MKIEVTNETSKLKTVVLGIAFNNGKTPTVAQCYDPKSKEHVLANTYPLEKDMIKELEAFEQVLKKYNVTVLRPKIVKNCNQIFIRDIAFVVNNKMIKSNILPNRDEELVAINYIYNQLSKSQRIVPPKGVHIEGGDVILHNDYIFVGTYYGSDYSEYITARTNLQGVQFLKELFPKKKVVSFNLRKSNTNAKENALHLDCCFQPIGKNKAIIRENGFLEKKEYQFLINLFGKKNVFKITKEEMYNMNSNIFSISEKVIVSENNFVRLNTWLKEQGFTVEKIPFAEISKQEGLLRCTTLPLYRKN